MVEAVETAVVSEVTAAVLVFIQVRHLQGRRCHPGGPLYLFAQARRRLTPCASGRAEMRQRGRPRRRRAIGTRRRWRALRSPRGTTPSRASGAVRAEPEIGHAGVLYSCCWGRCAGSRRALR